MSQGNNLPASPCDKTGCAWACRLGESSRSLLALPGGWKLGSGIDRVDHANSHQTNFHICKMVYALISQAQVGKWLMTHVKGECVTAGEKKQSGYFKLRRLLDPQKTVNSEPCSCVPMILSDFIIPCLSAVDEPAEDVCGKRGAEELRQQRAHLRVGGLSEGKPGPHQPRH